MAATQIAKIQVTPDSLKAPRVVLGKNRNNEEVYLYFDPNIERVVIYGAMGLAYASGSTIFVLDTTSPNNP